MSTQNYVRTITVSATPIEAFQGLNAQIPDHALQLSMAQKQLNRPQVFRGLENQCLLSTAHRVSTIGAVIQSGLDDALFYDSGVLSN